MYLRVAENCDFWSKVRFLAKIPFFFFCFFFCLNCFSFILQLNAENRINIRAVYNEVHVFNLFLYVIYMAAILSKFGVV